MGGKVILFSGHTSLLTAAPGKLSDGCGFHGCNDSMTSFFRYHRLVHTAPGHGLEDYYSCLDYGLPILCPVDDDGVFTEEAGPLQGLPVLGEGNQAALEVSFTPFKLLSFVC